MGTPDFAVPTLHALIETQEVVGVVTQPDRPAGRGQQLRPSPVKEAALEAGLPLYQPKSMRRRSRIAPIEEWQPDIIVVAAFGQILRPHLLDLPPYGCINVHASLLPRWRGAAPIQHAIMAGDPFTGITLMAMDEGLDTGGMYGHQTVPITAEETAATLHDKLAALGGQMLRQYLPKIIDGKLQAVAQDDSQATYAPMISKEDGHLDWKEDALSLHRRLRAMTPWPGAFTSWEGNRVKILEAEWRADTVSDQAGQVVRQGDDILVAAGTGSLALLRVQLAGKRATDIDDFVRGRPDFEAAVLGT